MIDDPIAASDPARSPNSLDGDHSDSDHGSQDEGDAGEGSSRPQDAQRPRGSRAGRRRRRRSSSRSRNIRRAKAGIAKKLAFMTQLMSSLDVVVIVELCILYYMDCSFFRLFLRGSMQLMYLTPRDEEVMRLLPPPRPHIYAILSANILCMLLHLVFAPLQATETTRGYLHGGLIIDFIGQKAPTSRFSLLFLDCLVLTLQFVSCAVWREKDRVKKMESTLSAGGGPKSTNGATPTAVAVDVLTGAATSTQDLDSEEQGILRDDPLGVDSNDIEMQPLVREQPPTGDGRVRGILEARHERIVRTAAGSDATDGPGRPSLLDILMSGNGLLADLHVPHATRTMMAENASEPSAAGYPLRLTGYGTRIAQLAVESQVRLERTRQRRAQRAQGGT